MHAIHNMHNKSSFLNMISSKTSFVKNQSAQSINRIYNQKNHVVQSLKCHDQISGHYEKIYLKYQDSTLMGNDW